MPADRTESQLAPTLRLARVDDLTELLRLENRLFTGDRISPRSFRHFLRSPRAALIVAASPGGLAGYALVLFREGAPAARLYSIAVEAGWTGRGLGRSLLAAAEAAALGRGCTRLRLEVSEGNARAAELYRRGGYGEIGRRESYYEDGGAALKFEKRLEIFDASSQPPYF